MKESNKNPGQKSIPVDQLQELRLIGYAIKELRFSYGLLTQKELAEKCGMHFNTIQAIEHGCRDYNLKSLMKIIHFFEYDLSTFIRELI